MNLIGSTLGGCKIAKVIGQGGMSVVYRAYQPALERWVAVKVLELSATDSTKPLRRFRREARAIANLRHPNILTVYDYGEEDGLAYIVMEYVAGGSLAKRLAKQAGRPLDWPTAAKLIIPVARALAFAHSQGIIHRDVKPANVLLGHNDWPLLADFGLVKVSQPRRKLTRPGVSLGTPLYTAPEQVLGEPVDQRADIYSLGMMLYEMLTGQHPFAHNTPGEALMKRLSKLPPMPRLLHADIPVHVETALMRALALQPEERYASMEDLIVALEADRPPSGTEPRWGSCPTCGKITNLGKSFCSQCGAPLAPRRPATPEPVATTRLTQAQPLPVGPRLMIPGTGGILPLPPQPEVVVGRSDPFSPVQPDVDLMPFGGKRSGVSRNHARLIRKGPEWQVEDLGSTNGTFVNEQPVRPGQTVSLHDGDALRCGQMVLIFYAS